MNTIEETPPYTTKILHFNLRIASTITCYFYEKLLFFIIYYIIYILYYIIILIIMFVKHDCTEGDDLFACYQINVEIIHVYMYDCVYFHTVMNKERCVLACITDDIIVRFSFLERKHRVQKLCDNMFSCKGS